MTCYFNLQIASSYIRNGDVIAYPTEAVFGIGCLPNCDSALKKVIEIKKRNVNKGMILISHNSELFRKYVNFDEISNDDWLYMNKFWPGPYTFILPAKPELSFYIRGNHPTVAVRVTSHPLVKKLCEMGNEPLISTSANLSSEEPCRTYEETVRRMGNFVDYVVCGTTLGYDKPSTIVDLKTKKILRN